MFKGFWLVGRQQRAAAWLLLCLIQCGALALAFVPVNPGLAVGLKSKSDHGHHLVNPTNSNNQVLRLHPTYTSLAYLQNQGKYARPRQSSEAINQKSDYEKLKEDLVRLARNPKLRPEDGKLLDTCVDIFCSPLSVTKSSVLPQTNGSP